MPIEGVTRGGGHRNVSTLQGAWWSEMNQR